MEICWEESSLYARLEQDKSMFERYTEKARRTTFLARYEARVYETTLHQCYG
jgi:hypothetical protein